MPVSSTCHAENWALSTGTILLESLETGTLLSTIPSTENLNVIFEPYLWDILIVVAAGYLAVISLVRMMRAYRQKLVITMRAMVLEKRAAAAAARKARRAAQQKAEQEREQAKAQAAAAAKPEVKTVS